MPYFHSATFEVAMRARTPRWSAQNTYGKGRDLMGAPSRKIARSNGAVRSLIIPALLVVVTLAAFADVRNYAFVLYDDTQYVSENPHIRQGLAGLRWALTSTHASNWHPLTWWSHMLDYQLFGLDPHGHHLTNLVLHTANTVLLFLALVAMTNSPWRSAFVAALFGVHPLRVESVAQVAERKDVLSGTFWMLTMWAYARYARASGLDGVPVGVPVAWRSG